MNLKQLSKDTTYIDSNSRFARSEFSDSLFKFLDRYYNKSYSDLIIMCIGSDRSTGDSLGPLVGHNLSKRLSMYDNIHVFGTLDDPVHATNLHDNIEYINENFANPFIVAVDACLGPLKKVGLINISNKPLRPGSGVNKVLPAVGDLSILGIVNTSGFMEHLVLQSTRLSLVMELSSIISSSFVTCIWRLKNKEKSRDIV